MGERLAKRVLLLGWDGADWKIIQPLLESGQMPHLERLINEGVMGNLATLKPILSPMLWTSVATGKRADKHGIHGFTEPRPDGSGVRPVSSTSLRAQPLWNILGSAGLKSAVVGWFATHPADVLAGTVVSDRFHHVQGSDPEDWPAPPRAVSPAALGEVLMDLRVHPRELIGEQIAYFVPGAAGVDQEKDGRLADLARLLARCGSVHAAGTYLAEHDSWDLLAVYYETIDRACHEFMEYRAPRMEHVAETDFALYKDVIDQLYRFHDLMLGRYMRLVGPDTTIVLISDHGFHSDHLRPTGKGASGMPVLWHREYGIFVARGPGIKRDELLFGASLLDIAPTVLTMLGLPSARDMEGRVLTRMFDRTIEPEYVDSYGAPEAVEEAEEDARGAQEALRQLAALGYVEEAPSDDAAKAIEGAVCQKLANLAEVHVAREEFAKAKVLLEDLILRRPEDTLTKLRLAQCRLHLGELAACRDTVDAILAENPDSPWGRLLLGMLLSAEGRFDEALEQLQQAQVKGPGLPNLHFRIGLIHLSRKRWTDAEAAFRTALDIDGDSAGAHDGLGLALMRQDRHAEAAETLLRSVALRHDQPLVHYHLGVALAKTGNVQGAVRAMETALAQRPGMAVAHQALAKICDGLGDVGKAQLHRSQAAMARKKRAAA